MTLVWQVGGREGGVLVSDIGFVIMLHIFIYLKLFSTTSTTTNNSPQNKAA